MEVAERRIVQEHIEAEGADKLRDMGQGTSSSKGTKRKKTEVQGRPL